MRPHAFGRHAREWLKFAIANVFERSGASRLGRRVRVLTHGARIHVLGYHRVVDRIDFNGPVNPSLCITAEAFRLQMEQVRERFVVVPLSWVMRAVTGEVAVPHDAVAITFDDGYRDVLLRAHPILRELGIPATVFVPTGFAERVRHLPHDRLYAAIWAAHRRGRTLPLPLDARRLLDQEGPTPAVDALVGALPAAALDRLLAELESDFGPPSLDEGAAVLAPREVRTLAEAGWEIGAHTVGHVVLTHEPIDEIRRQLVDSKRMLERWSGQRCRYFAYCNGFHSRGLVAELRRAGYEGAVTTHDRINHVGSGDPFRLGRKVLWEGHTRDPRGRFSPALSAAYLHDLFGTLRLTRPINGEITDIVQLHREPPTVEAPAHHEPPDLTVETHGESPAVVAQAHGESPAVVAQAHGESPAVVAQAHNQAVSAMAQSHHQPIGAVAQSHNQAAAAVAHAHHQQPDVVVQAHNQTHAVVVHSHNEEPAVVVQSHHQAGGESASASPQPAATDGDDNAAATSDVTRPHKNRRRSNVRTHINEPGRVRRRRLSEEAAAAADASAAIAAANAASTMTAANATTANATTADAAAEDAAAAERADAAAALATPHAAAEASPSSIAVTSASHDAAAASASHDAATASAPHAVAAEPHATEPHAVTHDDDAAAAANPPDAHAAANANAADAAAPESHAAAPDLASHEPSPPTPDEDSSPEHDPEPAEVELAH